MNRLFQKDSLKTPQRYRIGGRDIQEEKLLSEGGYGYIWKAYDVNTREVFALKKMICQGPERSQLARNEMDVLKKIPPCENIMRFYDGSVLPIEDGCMAIFLLEFCSGGSIWDLMVQNEKVGFSEAQVINMIKEIARGLKVLHLMNPPIAHRDIKIENVLLNNGRFKLCDFGSCSTQQVDFSRIPPSEFYSYEEFYDKNTTMMYRPPEMSDLYLKFEVNTKVDIWMLGCVLYSVCFFKHPFCDSSKLAISQAKYIMPKNSRYSPKCLDLIRHMLTPNPKFRPDVHEILDIVERYDRLPAITLNQQAMEMKMNAINEEKEIENFEKSLKPIKHFDGDIPLEELMNLKKKIENEGNEKSKPRKKIPPQKSTNSEAPINDWGQAPSNINPRSGFEGFNKGFQNPPPQFSNFSEWKEEKTNQNQNAFSFFENNFNFSRNQQKSSNQAWSNDSNFSTQNDFNQNINFNTPVKLPIAQQQDYSQFFNVSNNPPQVKPNLFDNASSFNNPQKINNSFPASNNSQPNLFDNASSFNNPQKINNSFPAANNAQSNLFDNVSSFNNTQNFNNSFSAVNNPPPIQKNPINNSNPNYLTNSNQDAFGTFGSFNNQSAFNSQPAFNDFYNQPQKSQNINNNQRQLSPNQNASPKKPAQTQMMDLIGIEEQQSTQKASAKPINLLEDLNSINFN